MRPPLRPQCKPKSHVAHQWHLVGLGSLNQLIKRFLAALEADVHVTLCVHLRFVAQLHVAQVERHALGPQAGLSLVDLLVQTRAVYVARRAEQVRVGVYVERKVVRPHVAVGKNLRRFCKSNGSVRLQHGVLAAGRVRVLRSREVENFKCKLFHDDSISPLLYPQYGHNQGENQGQGLKSCP